MGTAGGWHPARAPSDAGDRPMSPYHDGVAGAGGQVDVLGVGGDAVALLQEPRHVLPHQLDAGAGAVGTWGHGGDMRGSREVTLGLAVSPRGAHRRSGRRRPPAAGWPGPWRPTGWICRSGAPGTRTWLSPGRWGHRLSTGRLGPLPVPVVTQPVPARYLAEEGDGFLAHGVGVTDVGLDHLGEGLGGTLRGQGQWWGRGQGWGQGTAVGTGTRMGTGDITGDREGDKDGDRGQW